MGMSLGDRFAGGGVRDMFALPDDEDVNARVGRLNQLLAELEEYEQAAPSAYLDGPEFSETVDDTYQDALIALREAWSLLETVGSLYDNAVGQFESSPDEDSAAAVSTWHGRLEDAAAEAEEAMARAVGAMRRRADMDEACGVFRQLTDAEQESELLRYGKSYVRTVDELARLRPVGAREVVTASAAELLEKYPWLIDVALQMGEKVPGLLPGPAARQAAQFFDALPDDVKQQLFEHAAQQAAAGYRSYRDAADEIDARRMFPDLR